MLPARSGPERSARAHNLSVISSAEAAATSPSAATPAKNATTRVPSFLILPP